RDAGGEAGIGVAGVAVVALLARLGHAVAAAGGERRIHAPVVRLVAAVGGARVPVVAAARNSARARAPVARLVGRAELTVVAPRPLGQRRVGAGARRAHVGGAGVAVVRARAGAVGEDAAPHAVAGVGRALPPVVADARGTGLAGARPVAGVVQRAGVVVAA